MSEVQVFSIHRVKEATMTIVKCREEQSLNKEQPAFTLETNHIKAQMRQATEGSLISENRALERCLERG